MAEYPMFPLWTDAYLGDTHHLTCTEHGAYLQLLIAMWRNRAQLPADDRKLAAYTHLPLNRWRQIKPTIMEFFEVNGTHITQSRLTDEWDAVQTYRKSQSNNAKARWLKNNKSDHAAAQASQKLANAPPSLTPTPKKAYAFEGKVIRLDWQQYSQWSEAYKHIELRAELQRLDDYYGDLPVADKIEKDWFHRTSSALAKANREAGQNHESDSVPSFGQMTGIY